MSALLCLSQSHALLSITLGLAAKSIPSHLMASALPSARKSEGITTTLIKLVMAPHCLQAKAAVSPHNDV